MLLEIQLLEKTLLLIIEEAIRVTEHLQAEIIHQTEAQDLQQVTEVLLKAHQEVAVEENKNTLII